VALADARTARASNARAPGTCCPDCAARMCASEQMPLAMRISLQGWWIDRCSRIHHQAEALPPGEVMKSLRDLCGAAIAALAFTATSAHAGNGLEGIWADDWMGPYGSWLPLGITVVVCLIVWVVRRKQKK
jgi:hypothetical protein